MSRYVNHVLTDKSVVVVFDNKMIPVDAANPMYKTVKNLCTQGKYTELDDALDVAASIKKHSSGKFYVQDGVVFAEGGPMPSALSTRVLGFTDAGLDCNPLIKFWDNLKANPSESSRTELYAFLEANHVPITEDGCFIGYKKIGADFKDLYTHTLDNSVGKVVKMTRAAVDPNRQNTCSQGLHVAAFDYAANKYGSSASGDILVLVKVNPKDVVSVPPDYNQQKMRVCEYTVLEVYTQTAPLTDELWQRGVTPDVSAEDVNDDADDELDSDYEDDLDEYEDEEDDDFEDDDDEEDWDDEEFEDEHTSESEEVPADFEATLSADSHGRVCVPNAHIKHMGLVAGDTVYVTVSEGEVVLSPSASNTDDERTYTVDRDCNVRLSAGVFKDANLAKTSFRCRNWENETAID